MSEIYAEPVLLTVDAEFRDVYRRHGRKTIPTLLPAGATRSGKRARHRRSRA
jgi:hypothetical protein